MRLFISNTEKKILKILLESNEFLTSYSVSKKMYPKHSNREISNICSTITKVLNQLLIHGKVIKKNSFPTYYAIEKKLNLTTETILHEVECPCCKKSHWIDMFQSTRQCNCLKDNGKPRRFWITKNVFTGNKKLI